MSIFDTVQTKTPKSNIFDLSHDFKYSMDMGKVYPILNLPCIPGDKHNIEVQTMVRMAPMLAPIMHNVDVYVHTFFTPHRILFPEWEKFIAPVTEGSDPVAFPVVKPINLTKGSVGDYQGLPEGMTHDVSALPVAAYAKIWDEYYRDQNLKPEGYFKPLLPGNNDANYYNLIMGKPLPRAWRHDYFSSALPFAQKGASVSIPVGDFNDVPVYTHLTGVNPVATQFVPSAGGDFTGLPDPFDISADKISGNRAKLRGSFAELPTKDLGIDAEPSGFKARTSDLEATAVTIQTLRRAEALQKWFEKMARVGTRYTEILKGIFGVSAQDSRLDRPEYIFGSKAKVIISEVLQTSETSETPQGTMAGHGLSLGGARGREYFCHEHGTITVCLSIMPTAAYQQGIPREYSKFTREEMYWPEFANIGEQPILNKEIYTDGSPLDEQTFGYTPRYAEYKFMASRVAGDFRTQLDFWHMSRKFATRPLLNAEFVYGPPTKRIFAVTDENTHSLWCHSFFKIRSSRRMPVYGTPTL